MTTTATPTRRFTRMATVCRAGRLLLIPKFEIAEAFAALLADRRIPHAVAAEALTLDGFPVSEQVIRRHRLRLCCCYRGTGIAAPQNATVTVPPAERPSLGATPTEVHDHA